MAAPSQPPADLKSRLAASYDLLAPKYNDWTQQHSQTRLDWLAKLFAHLRAPDNSGPTHSPISVLELGAGAGLPTSKALLDYNDSVRATVNDLSQHQMQLARENLSGYGERVRCLPGDMMALSFDKGSLDVVVAMYSLIHLPREEQGVMLSRIKSWLRTGGLLLANFSAEAGQVIDENWLRQDGAWVFWSGWGADETTKVVAEQGFDIIEREIVQDIVDASFLWVLAKDKA